jgi:signal transduction histidine kinase/ligand-binding sensor domain-containing protein
MFSASKGRTVAIAFAIVFLCCRFVFALNPSLDVKQYAHTAWKVREGFAKGEITSIAQTPDGYIWLGTQFGLLRFDGVRAISWQPLADQHLLSSYVFSLLAARDGTLWIGTWNGLASWKDGRLTQYPALAEHYIFNLLEDRGGGVWVAGMRIGVARGKLCEIHNAGVRCYGDDGGLGIGVFGLYEDSKSNLWVGVPNGVWRWKPGPPQFYSLPDEPDGVWALGEDTDGTLLVGWKGGIHRLVDGKTEKYVLPSSVPRFRARRMLRDHDGGLWIGTTSQGLVHIHHNKTDLFAQHDGLSGEKVNAIFEDREGTVWAATTNGLDRFRDFAVPTLSVNQGLSSAVVSSVLADRDGSVWLGTHGGLDRWSERQIKPYRFDGDQRVPNPNNLPNTLFQDDRGRVWVSTFRQFGYLEHGQLKPIDAIPGGTVLSIVQDRAGNLWIANEQLGLFRLSPQHQVRLISWAELGHKDHVSALIADPSRGGLWIGFFLGGIAYFADGQIRTTYSTSDGLGKGRVSSFQFDHDGTLWASTDDGLSRIINGHVATLTNSNGLPCDSAKVNWVMEDDAQSFWLYMTCGLVRIARSELDDWAAATDLGKDAVSMVHATVFDTFDGVRSMNEGGHFSPQVAKTLDGRIWFLPWDGVSVVDPRHVPLNKVPPPVHVEQVIANRKTLDAASQLRLPPQIRDLEIDYTALSLVAAEKVLFRYKLEGFDHDWQQVGTRRQAFYTNLAPGNYRFRVAACNNSGVWNEEGATFDFSIAPAYFQTTWFRGLCVAAFLLALWGLYQLRLHQLAREFNTAIDARVGERTRIARELHDTLLQSLHGLMFRFQAARNMLPRRPEDAMEALDGAIARAEQAISESRGAIQGLRSETAPQDDLGQALAATAQELTPQDSNGDSPAFRMIVEGEKRNLSPEFHDEVCRMARELLRNAFQHARAQQIEAELRYDDQLFRLRVRDDGKGIDPAVLEQGGREGHWGLTGIRERAEQIGAQLDFWSEAGAGTEVQLTVPAAVAYKTSSDRRGIRRFLKARSHEQQR